MEHLQSELEKEGDPRRRAKLEKKVAKLAKFMEKTRISAQAPEKEGAGAPARERKRIEFAQEAIKVPEGAKKEVGEIAGQFNPLAVESGWYSWWEAEGFFRPEYISEKRRALMESGGAGARPREKFVVSLPPPNVTGSLHLGHAMMTAIQDSVVRFKRMKGCETLYLPGTDHAGIATQIVVEKQLAKEGALRKDLGRAKFLEKVWEWKKAYGSEIYRQLKRLGSSLDFTRERFTLDDGMSEAVKEAFVRFYEEGLIYRGNRLVNWCAKIQTSLSDLEVEHVSVEPFQRLGTDGSEFVFGRLFTVKYEVLDRDKNPRGAVEVSTTRPETIMGDSALCANPADARYQGFRDCLVKNPLSGELFPFIFDEAAEMGFGTGVLKITPAHDPVDFLVGERHNLEIKQVLDEHNTVVAGEFKGMQRFVARERVVEKLEAEGKLVRVEGYATTIPVCERTGEVIEPRLIQQWWMRCDKMAKRALDAVRSGDLRMVPSEMEKTWAAWLENIKDWCLSRQLWWGHQIPAYSANGQWYVARTREEAEEMAGCPVEQDEDVLDTWFSSGLWPFSTLGWPKSTPDVGRYYPTSLLETGKDIVFFWVARMVMMGLSLTGQVPFGTVFFHSIVRDAHGEKMSKSKGNVIDPVDVISGITLEEMQAKLRQGNLSEKEVGKCQKQQAKDFPRGISPCGSDALRFTLLSCVSTGRDVNLNTQKVEGYRRFCNKVWNATKLTIKKIAEAPSGEPGEFCRIADGWILSRLNHTVCTVTEAMEDYAFMRATSAVHMFFLYDFCDVYLEIAKLRSDAQGMQTLLRTCVDALRLLHPFMPFITEELYHGIKHALGPLDHAVHAHAVRESLDVSLCVDAYPEPSACLADRDSEEKMERAREYIGSIRSAAASQALAAGKYSVHARRDEGLKFLEGAEHILSKLAGGPFAFSDARGPEDPPFKITPN